MTGKEEKACHEAGFSSGLMLSLTQLTMTSREVPGKKISLIPSFLSMEPYPLLNSSLITFPVIKDIG
jgi:hypothetical protein